MTRIPKKPAIDYFEQMIKVGQPIRKKASRSIDRAEAKEQEVDDSLLEIYQNDQGQIVDVSRFTVRRRRWWVKVLLFMLYSLILVLAGWLGYNYYTGYRAKADLLTINIETDKNLTAGQEFTYTINYRNNGSVALTELEIQAQWPSSFIFVQSEPQPSRADNVWQIGNLSAKTEGKIVIRGRLINKIGETNQLDVKTSFRPVNLSSTFTINKEHNIILSNAGVAVGLSAPDTLAIGRDNEITIAYQANSGDQTNNLQLLINNVDWADIKLIDNNGQTIESLTNQSWSLAAPSAEPNNLKLIITPKSEASGLQILSLRLETAVNDRHYLIDSRDLDFQLINSKLNLLLKINDSNADSGVTAGQVLNYQLSYANQGDSTLKDVRLVASLQGNWLDWSSLKDKEQGQVSGQTIIWSKKELPELALLKPGTSGTINFSIKLKDWDNGNKADSGQITSYTYYQVGEDNLLSKPSDNQKSNTIINQLNSDFSFQETVVYFNEDNIAVGSGPLPLVVGETTNLKVYWQLKNSLHDLRDITMVADLPDYVTWAGKDNVPAGQIRYDQDQHQVVWRLDRLPANDEAMIGQFNIGITPRANQQNKIIILLPGSTATAIDNATQGNLEVTGPAKTSRLEDDQIVQTDGLVK
ncbi:MAG TPA: hypothetical protein PLX67_00705 [bacterium]|jgi:uncharacterized repeat protein (TIGR01451 family)|nr:hypothetical protein [bacterium]HNZ51403.1 hypothetical protein [bacterium]HOH85433.1 hypothetical protein [bacterium]HPW44220.1 hypothetical protein [bacterium]HPX63861.1 hypothetical protein [bacterium]